MYVCLTTTPRQNREAQFQTTVAEQRRRNIHVRDGITEDQFVALRKARDSTLEMPTLILPSIQVKAATFERVVCRRPTTTAWLPSHPAEHASSAEVNPTLRTGSDSGLTSP